MNSRSMPFPKAGAVAACALALVMSSCKPKPAGDDTAKADTSAPVGRILPGALPGNIDAMSTAELNQFLAGITLTTGAPQQRRCDGGGGCMTTAILRAVDGQRDIAPDDADGKGYGTLVVHARNRSPQNNNVESKYKLRGGGLVYLFVVHKRDAASFRWTLHQWQSGQNPSLFSEGVFLKCEEKHADNPAGADAKFQPCPDTARRPPLDDLDSPAWMTCTDGCCTAGDPS